jgi:hypothetical protein
MLKPIELNINVRIPQNGYFSSHNAVINLERLPFKSPGQYAVEVALDGESQTSIPLQVVEVKAK